MLKRSASNIINSTSTSTRSASNRYLTYFKKKNFFLTICLTIDVGKVFIESCVAPGCDVIQGSAMVKGDEAGFLCHILEKRKIIYTIQYVRIVNYFTDTWSLQRHYYLLGFVYSPNSNILKILK